MQLQVFAIPMEGDGDAVDELNCFLRANKILSIAKVGVVDQGRHYWSICVEYLSRSPRTASPQGAIANAHKPRLDYREILSPAEFDRFAKLRALRKQLAEAEGVPVYTILTNAQLAGLARVVPQSKTALAEVDGLDPAKVDRYGQALLDLLCAMPIAAPDPAVAPPTPLETSSEPAAAGPPVSP